MHLHLFIPHEAGATLARSADYPALEHLLALGKRTLRATTLDALICRALAVPSRPDGAAWPLAALCWHGEQDALPAAGAVLFADPVHLALQRDTFALAGPQTLTDEEHDALLAALNAHFAAEGLDFRRGASGRCYLHLADLPALQTFAPQAALQRDVRDFLPRGADAGRWHRLLNEMQMLLFDLPLNQARVERAAPEVNSLWLWGEGVLPPRWRPPKITLHAATPLLRGIARRAQIELLAVPADLDALAGGRDVWVCFDATTLPSDRWFSQIDAAMRHGWLRTLTLSVELGAHVLQVTLRRRDLWRFWRKPLPLVAAYQQDDHDHDR